MGEFVEQVRTQIASKKRKRLPKPKNTENEYTLAPLEAAGLLTKHMPGLHDQSTHGNRLSGYWGSHSGSWDITSAAAKIIGTDGFRMSEESGGKENKLSARTILRGTRDSKGIPDVHYSGHSVKTGSKNHKVGDVLEVPAMATSGDKDTAMSYARRRESDIDKDHVLYRFPPGLKAKGYSKNELRNDPDYKDEAPHMWDEAITSGRFHVTGVHTEKASFFHYGKQADVEYPVTVYTMAQDEVYDPDTKKWVKVGKEGNVSKGTVLAYISKRDVKTAERQALAAKGWALSDGSYPIKNTHDLKNAITLCQSGHGNVAAAKRLIIRRAGELGATGSLPSDWQVSKRLTQFVSVANRHQIAKRFWDEALHPRLPGGHHGGGEFMSSHSSVPGESRHHRDDVSPFPDVKPKTTRRATGAAKKTAAASTRGTVSPPAAKTPRVAAVRAPKAVTTPAPKLVKPTATGAPGTGLYDHKAKTITDRKLIPKINRGGTHIMYKDDERKKPLVASPISDPGKAYYARNADPKTRISNERLKEIFENPDKMTPSEKKMIASAGGAKSLDGSDTISVETSRGDRHLERYQVFGQLRSKIAPGSGDRSATRLDEEKREKLAAKRRASGKVSSVAFGKIEKQITEDWSTDGGKTVPCVFCGNNLPPEAMSIETPKPKALGGGYKDRGGVWPAHATCNTGAGQYAQKDPIAYQEQMMKQFQKLPLATRKRLPFVYDFFPQLGKYPGTAAESTKHTKGGKR